MWERIRAEGLTVQHWSSFSALWLQLLLVLRPFWPRPPPGGHQMALDTPRRTHQLASVHANDKLQKHIEAPTTRLEEIQSASLCLPDE